MFSRSRYVVIDDDPEQLRTLIETLHALGAPCRGIRYDAKTGLKPDDLHGVRILFLDLNLNGTAIAANKADFGLIAGMLEEGIEPAHGPYILILWTSHAEQLAEFSKYIWKGLTPGKLPLTILALDKKIYLVPAGTNEPELREAIEAAVKQDPRLQALLQWEHDVLAAAGATLAELGDLIPLADRTPERFSNSLDGILSTLAVASVGSTNAARDPRAAVSGALAPILADRIANCAVSPAVSQLWSRAVTQAANPAPLSEQQAGRMNAMIHLVRQGAETIAPTDWGAVVVVPDVDNDAAMKARFGLARGALMTEIFQIGTSPHRKKCKLVLIRAGAVCDYAQGRKGPITYILALLRPLTSLRAERNRVGGETVSPLLKLDEKDETFELITSGRFVISVADDWLNGADVPFRIRESLLVQLAAAAATYATRPGILEFPATPAQAAPEIAMVGAGAEPEPVAAPSQVGMPAEIGAPADVTAAPAVPLNGAH